MSTPAADATRRPRVLRGLHGHYARLTDALAAACLPARLRKDGMTTAALHGFPLSMFDRRQWWPRIGLTPWDSAAPQARAQRTGCNAAFPGLCDDTVLREAVAQSDASPGRFVYALTLDTHLPLSEDETPLDPQPAAHCDAAQAPPTACALVARLGGVLDDLAEGLSASSATPLVVVGDHSPPFVERANRDAFDPARVPLFVLEPSSE